jgi:hypothetical protein
MSDDEPAAATGGTNRTLVAGVVAIGLAAAAAVAAISTSRSGEGPEAVPAAVTGPGFRDVAHGFTAAHVGPVWVTLSSPGGSDRDVELRWGPWKKMLRPRQGEPVTYWFEKKDPGSVPISAEVPDGVDVAFGEGPVPPAGAVDARAGWNRRAPSAGEVPPAS